MNPFEAAPKSKKMLVIAGLYVGMFAMLIMAASFSTIVPVAAEEIGGLDIFPLAASLGGVLSVVGMPIYAYLGAKNPLLIRPLASLGILIGAVSSVIMGLASNMVVIIIGNIFFGFIAMGIYALGYPLVRHMFGQVKSGTYLGIFGTIMGVGMLVGPLLISAVLTVFGWRACFYLEIPLFILSAVLIFLGPRITREDAVSITADSGKFDWLGAISLSVMLAGFTLALSLGGTAYAPFGSTLNFGLIGLFVVGFITLIMAVRSKGDAGLIPLAALKDHNVKAFFFCNFLNLFAIMGAFFFIPAYILTVMGQDPFFALMAIALYAIFPIILGGPLGRIAGKTGSVRIIHTVGVVARIVIFVFFVFYLSPTANIFVVLGVMLLCGIYSSSQNCSFAVGPMIQLKPEVMMQGNSMIQLGQNFGSVVAVVIYSLILATFGYETGFPIALAIGAGATVISLFIGLTLRKADIPASAAAAGADATMDGARES